jgi:hypothetical protein
MIAASNSAFDFGASFGLGGGEGITGPPGPPGPPGLGLIESSRDDSWTSWVATTRGIGG